MEKETEATSLNETDIRAVSDYHWVQISALPLYLDGSCSASCFCCTGSGSSSSTRTTVCPRHILNAINM